MRRLLAALLVAAAGTAACNSGPPPREFEIVGQIQAVSPEKGEVTIKHQDIKGFMPGMTMPFKASKDVLDRQKPGDLVTGTLVVGEVDGTIDFGGGILTAMMRDGFLAILAP